MREGQVQHPRGSGFKRKAGMPHPSVTSLSFHIDSTFKKILIPCVDRRKFTWVQDAAYGVASGPGLYADKALYQRGGMYDCDDDNIVKMK